MINADPSAARRPGLPVPTRRDVRVTASADTGGAGAQDQHSAGSDRPTLRVVHVQDEARRDASVASASSRAGFVLQSDLPAPRRGLRADAVERARYRAAYERASRQPAPAPSLVRSA